MAVIEAERDDTSVQEVKPASGRRGRFTPRGRQVDPAALADVTEALGGASLQRDLLIEHLHVLQDRFGCLRDTHLAALAHMMRLSLVEVYEVATFYAHFDIVLDGAAAPAPTTVRICRSVVCDLYGADALQKAAGASMPETARVVEVPCIGACHQAPAAAIGHSLVPHATVETLVAGLEARGAHALANQGDAYEAYVADGGFAVLRSCLSGERTADDIIDVVEQSDLRGMGGAGFPAGRKWRLTKANPGKAAMAVNADEGEPGTFKDRLFMGRDLYRVLEGMLIAAWVVNAKDIYFYIRDEYPENRLDLAVAFDRLRSEGVSDGVTLHLRRGAGAYICGEETAMLESIEGKRGYPRQKPPFPGQKGLFGRPTLINNVETLYWVPEILEKGPDWYADQGANGSKGLRAYSVSGRVREPGVVIAPNGITVAELIDRCGGMEDEQTFAAYLPGGASGGILPASMADVPLAFGKLEQYGCFVGSGAVVILSDKDDLKAVALNLLHFFAEESCGQCTPCRQGTDKAVALMSRTDWDQGLLDDLATVMTDASICGLGQAAMNPVKSIMRFFPEVLER